MSEESQRGLLLLLFGPATKCGSPVRHPHWWEELTAIPEVGDLKELAQKIHASFGIPAVRCEAL